MIHGVEAIQEPRQFRGIACRVLDVADGCVHRLPGDVACPRDARHGEPFAGGARGQHKGGTRGGVGMPACRCAMAVAASQDGGGAGCNRGRGAGRGCDSVHMMHGVEGDDPFPRVGGEHALLPMDGPGRNPGRGRDGLNGARDAGIPGGFGNARGDDGIEAAAPGHAPALRPTEPQESVLRHVSWQREGFGQGGDEDAGAGPGPRCGGPCAAIKAQEPWVESRNSVRVPVDAARRGKCCGRRARLEGGKVIDEVAPFADHLSMQVGAEASCAFRAGAFRIGSRRGGARGAWHGVGCGVRRTSGGSSQRRRIRYFFYKTLSMVEVPINPRAG